MNTGDARKAFPGLSISEELSDIRKAYKEVLPTDMFEFYERVGVGVVKRGKFQFVNPIEYKKLIAKIFTPSKTLHPKDMALIGLGPYGDMYVWHKRYGRVFVGAHTGYVSFHEESESSYNLFYITLPITTPVLKMYASDNTKYLPRLISVKGALRPGQIFSTPDYDETTVAAVNKVEALHHLSTLFEHKRFEIYKWGLEDRDEAAEESRSGALAQVEVLNE